MSNKTLGPTQVHNLQVFVAETHENMMKRVELVMSITAYAQKCTTIQEYVLFTLKQISKVYGVITDDNLFSVLDELARYQLIPDTLSPWVDRELYALNADYVQQVFLYGLSDLRTEDKVIRIMDVYMGYEIV